MPEQLRRESKPVIVDLPVFEAADELLIVGVVKVQAGVEFVIGIFFSNRAPRDRQN